MKLAKLAKTNCIQVLGIQTRDQFVVATIAVKLPTTPPPPSVAIFYILNKDRIHMNSYILPDV
jgi:hypothetical protein